MGATQKVLVYGTLTVVSGYWCLASLIQARSYYQLGVENQNQVAATNASKNVSTGTQANNTTSQPKNDQIDQREIEEIVRRAEDQVRQLKLDEAESLFGKAWQLASSTSPNLADIVLQRRNRLYLVVDLSHDRVSETQLQLDGEVRELISADGHTSQYGVSCSDKSIIVPGANSSQITIQNSKGETRKLVGPTNTCEFTSLSQKEVAFNSEREAKVQLRLRWQTSGRARLFVVYNAAGDGLY